jgi:hypothetical protein
MVAKFDQKELEKKQSMMFGHPVEVFNYPLNQQDAKEKFFHGDPRWQMMQAADTTMFNPHIIPDVVARGFVFEAAMGDYMTNDKKGGKDIACINLRLT